MAETIVLNRFKLLVLAIILAIFTILFFQNQESLSLKFFCSDTKSEYCFYQTPSISLAVWMAIFMLLGIFSSLVWQLLKGAGNSIVSESKSSSRSSRPPQTRTSYRQQSKLREEADFQARSRISSDNANPNISLSDWEQRRSEDWEPNNMPNFAKDDAVPRKTPEARPRDAHNAPKFSQDNQSNQRVPRVSQTQPDRFSKESSNSQSSKPSVSKNTEEVYDASYRTLNDVPPPSTSKDNLTEDEDADWI
ncbi:MAG: hypothetical protein AAGA80_05160 [Cyanobacteria bacterium P01_F01_bin.143]